MNDARDVARWIEEFRFTPTRGNAYDMGDVDRFLDVLVAAVRRGEPLGEIIAGQKLRTVGRLREGYDRAEVDSFLAQLSAGGAVVDTSAASGSGAQLVRLIEDARFGPVRRAGAYDMSDVDQLLDFLARAIEQGEPVRPVIAEFRLRTTKLREGYDQHEVNAFLERIAAEDETREGGATTGPDPVAPIEHTPVVQEQKGLWDRLRGN